MKLYVKYKIISVFLVGVFMLAMITTLSKSGVLPISTSDSELAKVNKVIAEDEAKFNDTISGDITDCKGVIIQENTKPTELGLVPDEYAYIVGFRNEKKAYALHNSHFQTLYDGKNGKGKSIELTIDNDIQLLCAELLNGTDGCAVIMKRNSGEIKAMVSTDSKTTFTVNDLGKIDENVKNIWYPKYEINEQPGSVSKLFSTACILETGNGDFTYNDTKGFIDYNEGRIPNYDAEIQGVLDLETAVVKSSNVYFAEASKKVKREQINELADKFLFNQDIKCDFGTVNTIYDLGKSSFDRGSAFYGQGKTLFSAVTLAMLTQGVCDRNINKPHVIKTSYRGTYAEMDDCDKIEEEILSANVVSAETSETMDKYLLKAAESYGIPAELNVRAKTGTADIVNNLNRATICSYNDEYIVVISETNTDKTGSGLVDKLIHIYEYMI